MKIAVFAEYLKRLDETPKRLEITDILTQLIKELASEETDKAIYLASGYLNAAFEGIKFNLADKMMVRVLEQAYKPTGSVMELYKQLGDLGNVAFELAGKNKDKGLELTEVYTQLSDVAGTEGTGSQERKAQKLSDLLKQLSPLPAKYIVRVVLGTMRLGFTELTIIDALAKYLGDKNLAGQIESRYNAHPDIGLIAKLIRQKGIKGIKDIEIETGVPILSQKAQRVSGMEEAMERLGTAWAEFKFDGTRVQLHFDKTKKLTKETETQTDLFGKPGGPAYLVKTYTRNLEETTHQYPDLVEAAEKQIKADSVILDGEGIGFNRDTGAFLPFQETIQRKRKHAVDDTVKNIPIKYFVFDILYLNGKPLVDLPLKERRKILADIITTGGKAGDTIMIDEHLLTPNLDELAEYFETAKEKGLEGLVVKSPDDPYQAGARSYSWIKLKKADEKLLDDSVDCVVLGYYAGKGVRSKFGIGGFLVGIYDEKADAYKTITKIGTGLKEDDWAKLKHLADQVKITQLPTNVDMHKIFTPDVITKPKIVVEIGADEITVSPTHTAGYALRFPRLLKFREDKKPTEATTLTEIQRMYKIQKQNNSKVALEPEK